MKFSNIFPILIGSVLVLFIVLVIANLVQYPHSSERLGRGMLPASTQE